MKKTIKVLGIIVLVAVIGFSMVACGGDDDSGGGGGGGGGGNWREKKSTSYTITDGVASAPSEAVYNWIIYRYTSDTNYESKFTVTSATASTTNHYTRNGQNFVSSSESSTYTAIYDSESTLESKVTNTYSSSSGTPDTLEYTYNIEFLDDNGGVKTYKRTYNTKISNGVSQDVSTQGYSECKIKNGRKLEEKFFSADGVLSSTTTYTLSDNAVIKAKLGNYRLSSTTTPTSTSYNTVEVLSDSATELVIRGKTFTNNVLSGQRDDTYEKVK